MASTLFNRVRTPGNPTSAAAAEAFAAYPEGDGDDARIELLSTANMATSDNVASDATLLPTSFGLQQGSKGGDLSPTSSKNTANTAALNSSMEMSDESEFNDWNDDDEDCNNNVNDDQHEHQEDEDEDDSRFMTVNSVGLSPSDQIGGIGGGGCGCGGAIAVHEDDISQLRFGESVSVCSSALRNGAGGGSSIAKQQHRSSLELDAFTPMPTSISAGIKKVVADIIEEGDEEEEDVLEDIEQVLERTEDVRDRAGVLASEALLSTKAPDGVNTGGTKAEVSAPRPTTRNNRIQALPPPPPDIRRKSRSIRRKNKVMSKQQKQHHRSPTDITGATPVAGNTSPQGEADIIVPPEISLATPTTATNGRMGSIIMADLARAAAAYSASKSSMTNARSGPGHTAASPMDTPEGSHANHDYGGADRSFSRKRSDKRKKKKERDRDRRDRGGSRRSQEGGDDDEPTPSYDSAFSFDSEHIQDYELPPAVEYLSLALPLVRSGGEESLQAPMSPKSGATLSTVGSTDWEDASVRTESKSVLTHQGTSAADRVAETIRCANPDATSGADDAYGPLPTFDTVDRSMKRINEARELGTVKTIDEDEEIYRPLGPVDVDDAKFVEGKAQNERKRHEDFLKSIRDGTTDLWEAAARAQQYIREGKHDHAERVYKTLLDLHRRQYGPSHLILASSHHNISVVLTRSGNYSEAQSHGTEALRIRRIIASMASSRASDNLAVATYLTELSIICYARDEFGRALRYLREALQLTCNALGYDHPMVARILNTIGCVHYETGKLVASLATFEESLDIQRGVMGSNASGDDAEQALLNNATTLLNVAMVSIKRRQYDSAISLLEEGHMVLSSVRGDDYRMAKNAAETLELLVNLREGSGEVVTGGGGGKADRLHIVEVLGVSPSKIAARYESTVSGGATLQQVKSGEADTVFSGNSDGIPKKAEDSTKFEVYDSIDRISLGPLRHELTPSQRIRESILASLVRSSRLEDNLGENAIPQIVPFSPSDQIKSERAKGSMRVDEEGIMDAELHLRTIYDQALEHLKHDEFDEATDLFDSTLQSHREKYGALHHLVGTALHNIGVIHLHAEHYDRALDSFREAVNVRTATLGPEHPDVAASLTKTGLVLAALQDYDSALVTFMSVLRLQRTSYGSKHPQVGKVLSNIGCMHYEMGDFSSSKRAFEEAIEIEREHVQTEDNLPAAKLTLSRTLLNAGFVYEKNKDSGEAIVAFEEALQIQRDVLGPSNKTTIATLECLAVAMAAANWQDDEDDVEIGGKAKEQMIQTYIDMLRGEGYTSERC